jgi:hypothetical protein
VKDEDIEYGKRQQRMLDEGTWKRRPLPQFAKGYGVQQYARHDPAPHLSFSNSWEPPRYTRAEVWTVRVLWVVTVAAMVAAEVLSA